MIKVRPIIIFPLLIVSAFGIGALTGCSGSGSGSVADVPTLASLPTLADTHTPTTTATPSATPNVSATPTSSPTASATATRTATRTVTRTATATATPTRRVPTATNTLTRTATASNTPPATVTSTPTITPLPPQILAFSASANTAAGGTAITLFWQTQADVVFIQRLNAQLVVEETTSVTPSGQLPVTVPNISGQVIYRLVAQRGTASVTRDVPIQVTQTCTTPWFFGSQFVPPGAGCPQGPAVTATGAYQPFERGLMILVNITTPGRVYGFNVNDGRYMVYTNTWDGATVYPCPCGTAPAGRFDAQGVFNWAYVNTNGTAGTWYGATGIGWATTGPDTANQHTIQYEANGVNFFIRIPGYGVIRVVPIDGATGNWFLVPGA